MELKRQLLQQRHISFYSAKCPICDSILQDNIEMHEVFITKGDVQGCPDEIKELINSPFNCVNLHSGCHNKAQHTPTGKLLCARQILFYEGATRVMTWLFEMDNFFAGETVENEIRYINEVLLQNANRFLFDQEKSIEF